ncbi:MULTISPECIES: hypothetical protein [unclassified Amycolatopsis]|uniref:hypothetical protein n=1 Tax=unclassified Amycolatopsis TaxID=2618356 RepID=UPI002875A4BB|nr:MULTISPECIES: hypothetical protein [unclassified Amycolatopsis]MDS0134286.1 hypothetical protein [Amycolatopsis sp. 505]MDS0149615.1 hypothetical protein [Amycolatopsis sp. CM201R]
MDDQPHITVTALGNSGSGKTTFLLGMYAIMSAGLNGYFLNAPDQDVDLQLAARWERLLDDGELPPPNPGEMISYSFDFLDGLQRLLGIDWLDYRGGALSDARGSESEDVPVLHERLAGSDSVYLVLDGSYLVDPVRHATRGAILRETGLRRMTSLLQGSVQQRIANGAPPPSLVVLVTKSDLVPPARRQRMEDIVDDIQRLLPICFQEGFTTLICPVQLGEFGQKPPDRVPAGLIGPQRLHYPIVFSLAEYMRLLSLAAAEAANEARLRKREAEDALRDLRRTLFGRGRMRDAEAGLLAAQDEEHDMNTVREIAEGRAKRLYEELPSRLPMFRDGHEVLSW